MRELAENSSLTPFSRLEYFLGHEQSRELAAMFRTTSRLPLHGGSKGKASGRRWHCSRYPPRPLVVFVLLGVLIIYYLIPQPPVPPPNYKKLRQWERNLPQHNASLPFPEGRSGRYVRFTNQNNSRKGKLGWNNVFNEVLLNAHLAHASNRAFVFQDYIWNPTHWPWPRIRWWHTFRHPRSPMAAFIAGPIIGEPWGEGDDAPRSVSLEYFDKICPKSRRRILKSDDIKEAFGWREGQETFDYWAELLRDAPESCVEIVATGKDTFPQVFDLWLFGEKRILSLWESFSKSATSRLLRSSPIVTAAVARNEYLFLPRGPKPHHPVSPNPYDRMLTMHVRRGDFKGACLDRMYWNSTFYSWNQLPQLPDPLVFPTHLGWNTPQYSEAVVSRCLPDQDQIVAKARIARDEWIGASRANERTLDTLYLLTNEKGRWLEGMKEKLIKDGGWHTIVTSHDLELDSEGVDAGMAVDMDIARLSAVFIGNGWSSFTSNIVHRRLVDGKEPDSIRFF